MHAFQTLDQVQEQLSNGSTTCEALVHFYLERIAEKQHLNAFLETFDKSALDQAKRVDARIKSNKQGKLAGLVIGIKDNIAYKGHKVSASSKILEGFKSLYHATVVERLLEEDAIIIGRLNCDEFAMGSSNEHSAFGKVLNPHDESRVPGGSSGGSAAAVAAGLCMATLGSDTGGSIRQPAAFCGTVGLKPTYGRVSRWGLLAYGSSLDQIGPLTHSVRDAERILEVISGPDAFDATLDAKGDFRSAEETDPTPKKIAYIKETVDNPNVDQEVKDAFKEQLKRLKSAGHTVEEVQFDYLDQLVPTYYILSNAEASSNLARYDGIHYGYRSDNAKNIESTYVNSRTEGFGKEVKRRIMLGTFVLSAGYYDAYYTQAQKVRRLISDATRNYFKTYDFVLSPTTPHPAFRFGANSEDPVKMYLEDIFTVQANLVGTPAISLPLASTRDGLPIGIQIMADRFEEAALLAFAATLETHKETAE